MGRPVQPDVGRAGNPGGLRPGIERRQADVE